VKKRQTNEPELFAIGKRKAYLEDIYHRLMKASWTQVIGAIVVAYFGVNLLFAYLFWLDPTGVTGMKEPADAFWFSVQSIATIGYGGMVPTTVYANMLVTIEALVGFIFVAVLTGVVFAKFSIPTSKVAFSDQIVVHERNGIPSMILRVANARGNRLVEAKVTMWLLFDDVTTEGEVMRRFIPLKLVRDMSPVFRLTWTIMHELDESSPLHGLSADNVKERVQGIILTIGGVDMTYVASVYDRYVYRAEDIHFDARFVDMLTAHVEGITVDYSKLSDIEPNGSTPAA